MGDPSVISWFDDFPADGEQPGNAYRFLSNFYVGFEPIKFHGRLYRSGEHMFQAFKARTKADHDMVVGSATPAEAKANGKRMLRLRPDWERVKYDVMRLVLAMKFRPGREECALLLATGDALLVEGTHWGDQVWGVDLKKGREAFARRSGAELAWEEGEGWEDAPGRNWLGALLMTRRAELVFWTRDPRGLESMYSSIGRFAMDVPRAP